MMNRVDVNCTSCLDCHGDQWFGNFITAVPYIMLQNVRVALLLKSAIIFKQECNIGLTDDRW